MSCLFHLFSKDSSDTPSKGPKLPPLLKAVVAPKPTFCIYDSDDSETRAENADNPINSHRTEFPLLDSFQLLKDNPISLPHAQEEISKELHQKFVISPKALTCYPCSVISTDYQEIYLADSLFLYLTLDEDQKPQEHERKANLTYALLQLESEKREMNFDKSLPFIPQSKFPKIRKFSASNPHSPLPYSGSDNQSTMGNSDSKLSFQRAVEQLGSPGPVEAGDVAVWDQLCQESLSSIQDVFLLLPAEEIRKLREDSPANLSTLCYKVKYSWTR